MSVICSDANEARGDESTLASCALSALSPRLTLRTRPTFTASATTSSTEPNPEPETVLSLSFPTVDSNLPLAPLLVPGPNPLSPPPRAPPPPLLPRLLSFVFALSFLCVLVRSDPAFFPFTAFFVFFFSSSCRVGIGRVEEDWGMENEAGGRLRIGEGTKEWFTALLDICVLGLGCGRISAGYIELGASGSVREIWTRENEVEWRTEFEVGLDGLPENVDVKGMSGENGDAAVEGEETKSKSEL